MLEIYQHLPGYINPIVVSVGFLNIRWYSLMYLVAFITVYFLLKKRAQKINYNQSLVFDFLIYAIVGLLIGARLGYVFFYNFSYFLKNPLLIISPYDFYSDVYTGISGMSYFGGLIGIILATLIFVRKNKLYPHTNMSDKSKNSQCSNSVGVGVNFWSWADFIIPAVPAGYFFGRIGNFLNGELYGRVTVKFWGMYFSGGGGILRHPSQLYEAFFEGVILFLILWILRDKSKFPGQLLIIYFFGYGFFRFFIEFFREPDAQIGLLARFLTLGQFFSLGLIASSLILYFWQKSKKMIE